MGTMANKNKGVSPVIAWVLLVGLAVTLAIGVYNWSSKQAEGFGKDITSKTERDMRCEGVAFNAVCVGKDISVINKGDFTIHKFIIHEYESGGIVDNLEKTTSYPLKPGKSSLQFLYKASTAAEKMDLIPIIKIEEEYVPCMTKKIVLEC